MIKYPPPLSPFFICNLLRYPATRPVLALNTPPPLLPFLLLAFFFGTSTLKIGVHIADVTRFLEADGPLDKEARVRATTVYLVHRRIDMLPALLSSDLCSLHAGYDRLSVSVVWEAEEDGEDINLVRRYESGYGSEGGTCQLKCTRG